MIVAKINCAAIDKAKLYQGEKGKYLDIVLIETPASRYGDDFMVVQGTSKEEREKGIKGAILGNAKIIGGKKPAPPATTSSPTEPNF